MQLFGQFQFGQMLAREKLSLLGIMVNSFQHMRIRMTENQRPPTADIVDKAIAVRVFEIATFAPGDETGRAADATEGANGRIYTTGGSALGASE